MGQRLAGFAGARFHFDLDIHLHQATLWAILLALGAAACFGISSALQHRSSNAEPTSAPLDPSLMLRLVRNRLWLVGAAADAAGLGLQVLALNRGSLVLVEPLLTVAVLVAAPLGAAMEHRRVTRRELVLLSVVVATLAAFLIAARPNEGASALPPHVVYAVFVVSASSIVISLVLASAKAGSSVARSVLIALAGGIALGASSAMIKSVTTLIGHRGFAVVTHPATYALIVLGAAALLLTQNAFQAGPLGPTLAILTVTEPLIGVAIGLIGLQEHIAGSLPARVVEVVTAVGTVVGLTMLCLEDSGESRETARLAAGTAAFGEAGGPAAFGEAGGPAACGEAGGPAACGEAADDAGGAGR